MGKFKKIFISLLFLILIVSLLFYYLYKKNEPAFCLEKIETEEVSGKSFITEHRNDLSLKTYFDKILDNGYFQKNDCIYRAIYEYYIDSRHIVEFTLVRTDPKTFTSLDYNWYKDKTGVYYYNHYGKNPELFPDIDPETTIFYNDNLIKDKKNVFNEIEVMVGADPATFTRTSEFDCYYKDKNNIYWRDGDIIVEADNLSFNDKSFNYSYLGNDDYACYAEDKNYKYKKDEIIEDWDKFYKENHESSKRYESRKEDEERVINKILASLQFEERVEEASIWHFLFFSFLTLLAVIIKSKLQKISGTRLSENWRRVLIQVNRIFLGILIIVASVFVIIFIYISLF
jgi:hypothetical protein